MSESQDQALKDFVCPECRQPMAYGLKECPNCHVHIYYRDMKETFWNDRKRKLLWNSSSIQNHKLD